jgi:DHA1 family tetracycline resistance protein-like MFS transporter
MPEPSQVSEIRSSHRRMLILICTVVFLDILAFGILIPVITPLVRQFTSQAFVVGLTFTAFASGQFVVSPLLGALSDRYGRRLILLTSSLGGMVASYWLGFANSVELILFSRFLDGCTGGNLLTGQAYIADITPPELRARSFGLIGAAISLGFVFGPAIGGGLSLVNPQLPAFVAGTLYFVTALLVWRGLPESLPTIRRRKESIRWTELNPLTNLFQAFQRPSIRLLLLVVFLLNFAENGVRSNIQVLTEDRFGFAIQQNALLLSYLGLLGVLMQGFAIRPLTKLIPERTLTIVGLGFMIVGYSSTSLAPSVGLLYGSLTFSAIGFSLTSPTLLSSLSKAASGQEQGFIIGANQAISSLATIVSPILAGLTFDRLGTGAPYWTGAILLSVAMLTMLNCQLVKSHHLS